MNLVVIGVIVEDLGVRYGALVDLQGGKVGGFGESFGNALQKVDLLQNLTGAVRGITARPIRAGQF